MWKILPGFTFQDKSENTQSVGFNWKILYFQDKAENFVQAALFCASEEGNVQGIKSLTEMAQKIDLTTANRVSVLVTLCVK